MPAAAVALAASAACAALAASPAHAATPAPSITVVGDPAGTVHLLTPGEAARWYVGETTRNVTVQQLTATLAASGDVQAPADDDLRATQLGLTACSVPWQGATCPGAVTFELAPTSLATIADSTASVSVQGRVPADNYLLITAVLPASSPQSVGGKTTVLRLDLAALGVEPPATNGPAAPAAPGVAAGPGLDLPGGLARTGTRIGVFALLAASAVGTGALLAGVARRRREQLAEGAGR
ncbi:hypothetical protein GCM10022286_21880 [Gryllotalpicola daejeonensis]|uniref:Gram-positive cocci surface proteins LPxTG domain-containing protein n=2 Tax=Gryllotalpicola daejeonensis TaxID=993087 RepID=A0ABP7ZL71_9MICO